MAGFEPEGYYGEKKEYTAMASQIFFLIAISFKSQSNEIACSSMPMRIYDYIWKSSVIFTVFSWQLEGRNRWHGVEFWNEVKRKLIGLLRVNQHRLTLARHSSIYSTANKITVIFCSESEVSTTCTFLSKNKFLSFWNYWMSYKVITNGHYIFLLK